MAISWVRDINETPRPQAVAAPEANPPKADAEKQDAYRKERKGARRPSKKTGQDARSPKEDVQLEIQIEKSADAKDGDDDSR
jgi:hypothetical protein